MQTVPDDPRRVTPDLAHIFWVPLLRSKDFAMMLPTPLNSTLTKESDSKFDNGVQMHCVSPDDQVLALWMALSRCFAFCSRRI